jgi:hypothetical protein
MVAGDLQRNQTAHRVTRDGRVREPEMIQQADDRRDMLGEHITPGDRIRAAKSG